MYADDNKVMTENELQIMADNNEGSENGLKDDINIINEWCESYIR